MSARKVYRRVGVVFATEVHIEAQPGQWIRDEKRSSLPVSDLVNDWCTEHEAEPITVSAPQVELIAVTEEEGCKIRAYRVGVSFIYIPEGIIDYGQDKKEEKQEPTLVRETRLDSIPLGLEAFAHAAAQASRSGQRR